MSGEPQPMSAEPDRGPASGGDTPTVALLLSTYNGESFLAAQLDSLLRQTHGNFLVVARDDGSTDGTPAILENYRRAHPALFFLLKDDAGNRGPSASFSLLCEYVLENRARLAAGRLVACFCDQDDVWADDKLEVQLAALLEAEAGDSAKPVLVHSDLTVVDESLAEIDASFARYQGLETDRRSFPNLAISNLVTGCTAMFNEALMAIALPVPKRAIMHDWWFAMAAAAFGELVFLPQPLIKYRQHGSNTIGAKPRPLGTPGARSLLARLLGLQHNAHLVEVAVQAQEFSRHFAERLGLRQRLALFLCRRMRSRSALLQRVYYRLARRL